MVKEELYINGESVELLGSLNPNLTFNIADIAKPDTRKADHSKTIELPASKKINKIFEHIFDLNTDLQSFNPNLKTDVVYLVNGEIQIDGYLQLKSIKNKDGEIIYNCIIIGRIGNFIAELQNNELTDLDLSSLDHTYTKANQSATWNYPLTTDYVYPMINYNVNYGTQSNNTELWRVTDLYPAIKAKKYIDAIFSSVDYSYTSTFLTSDFFNTLIIPFSAKEFNLDETAIENRIIEANTPQIVSDSSTSVIPIKQTDSTTYDSDFIKHTVEVRDTGNIYDNLTGVLEVQVGKAGYYSLNTMLQLQGVFTTPSAALTSGGRYVFLGAIEGVIELRVLNSNGSFNRVLDTVSYGLRPEGGPNAFPPNTAPATVTNLANPTAPDSLNYFYPQGIVTVNGVGYYDAISGDVANTNAICNQFKLSIDDVYLNEGEKIKIVLYYAVRQGLQEPLAVGFWYDSIYPNVAVAGGSFGMNVLSGYLKTEYLNREVTEGATIPMNSTIPRKVKQKDFIMSLVKMFNLYMQPDPNNERNLIIEPRDDFYSNDIVDWSNKLDISKDIESKPMGALNFKEYLYTYKQDKDYYNKQYFDTWEEVYGQDDFTLVNQFVNGQYKTEVLFSPTPSVGQSWYDRVLPTIIKFDDNNGVQKTESNIRILQWGGMKATGQQWSHIDVAGNSTNYSTYPYSGMYDDPYSPTTLLDFGLSNEVYYSNVFDKVITFSNNTLFNKYYSKFLQEITDNNSKIVSAYFYLSPSDIKQLSFSKQYYFENQYFRLNKIENYNPSNPITKCEFLKIKLTDVFVPTTGVSHGGPKEIGGNSIPRFSIGQSSLRNGNVVNNLNQKAIGSNNYISSNARGVNIIGDSNKIFSNTKNIQISGNNNTVESGLENVQLINTSNQTVTNSDTTYVNGTITGPGASQTITANTVASENVQIYFCDSSAASFYVEFRGTNLVTGKTFTFKKVSSTNQVTIDATYSNHTIDGQGTYVLNSHYKYVTIQFDGQNFLITSNN
jgi:hypothetical protein